MLSIIRFHYTLKKHKINDKRYKEEDFTTTNELIEMVISLPMHTELDEEQLAFITKTINDFV